MNLAEEEDEEEDDHNNILIRKRKLFPDVNLWGKGSDVSADDDDLLAASSSQEPKQTWGVRKYQEKAPVRHGSYVNNVTNNVTKS